MQNLKNQNIKPSKLLTSKQNMRRLGREKRTEELADSIERDGLIQPLTVYKVKDGYEVDAGQRRHAAIKILIERGVWGADQYIPCRVIPKDADTIDRQAVSYAENIQQLPTHPLDQLRFLKGALKGGKDMGVVASRFGLSKVEVEKVMTLDRLALPIRAAYAKGEIALDEAVAFATCVDMGKQMEVFNSYWQSAHAIRQKLGRLQGHSRDAMTASHRLFQFVGKDEYTEAGGTVQADLFTPENLQKVDARLVRDMAQAKLETAVAELIAEGGYKFSVVDINSTRFNEDRYEEWYEDEADCPVDLGIHVCVDWQGNLDATPNIIDIAAYEAWETASQAALDDDLSDVTPSAEPQSDETEAVDAPKAPSRPMDEITRDALTEALGAAVADDFNVAFDVVLHTFLCKFTHQSEVSTISASFRDTVMLESLEKELEASEALGFKADLWKVIDAWTQEEKQSVFAVLVGATVRADTRQGIDRPAPTHAAVTLANRTQINMVEAWGEESREDYYNKMTTADINEYVLGGSRDRAVPKADVVMEAMASNTQWLPRYFDGIQAEPAAQDHADEPAVIAAE